MCVDVSTQNAVSSDAAATPPGVSLGSGFIMGATHVGGETIRCDQGLDTTEISSNNLLDADLVETQYIIEMDNRLGSLIGARQGDGSSSFIY